MQVKVSLEPETQNTTSVPVHLQHEALAELQKLPENGQEENFQNTFKAPVIITAKNFNIGTGVTENERQLRKKQPRMPNMENP